MKLRNRLNRRPRRGFTLMEVLVVMAILVVLASTVTFAYLKFFKNAQADSTKQQIAILERACDSYKLDVGVYPGELADLMRQPANNTARWRGPYIQADTVPADAWGQPFTYQADNVNDRVRISSNGPDGQQGTGDDISMHNNVQ